MIYKKLNRHIQTNPYFKQTLDRLTAGYSVFFQKLCWRCKWLQLGKECFSMDKVVCQQKSIWVSQPICSTFAGRSRLKKQYHIRILSPKISWNNGTIFVEFFKILTHLDDLDKEKTDRSMSRLPSSNIYFNPWIVVLSQNSWTRCLSLWLWVRSIGYSLPFDRSL